MSDFEDFDDDYEYAVEPKCCETVSRPISLPPVHGLEGPKYLTMEYYREYDFGGRTYRISDPLALYYRNGGSTHRVIDREGVVHCVPAPGYNGCVLRWKNRDVEIGADPVTY